MKDLMTALLYAVALLAGALAGFFIVFNSIFSDVSSDSERVLTFVLVTAVYAILGLIFGFLARSWVVAIALAVPAVLLVIWYSFREPGNLLLHLAYIVVPLAASYLGAHAGAALRARWRVT